ncbi:P-type ATPase [Colletotrichum orchidophilum]|uniref:P-type ATPase n=1 Tax=Colletotrichum orchidophilum TaxID=1209926 RepID=A0A1G4B6F6_9PEZI|nr:P-type ATPase [Colletotrichum orchidophilum]OHE96872.1 P-type ATPase [Colletotrichum orchidophilum]
MTFISNDLEKYHEQSDHPAGVNTAYNLDEIGQISCVFSDKTGTLTENIKTLRRLSIAGMTWSHRMDIPEGLTEITSSTSDLTTEHTLEYNLTALRRTHHRVKQGSRTMFHTDSGVMCAAADKYGQQSMEAKLYSLGGVGPRATKWKAWEGV